MFRTRLRSGTLLQDLQGKGHPLLKRKTSFVLFLVFALILSWVVIITDKQVRDHLGSTLYIIGFAITGCMILVLAGCNP